MNAHRQAVLGLAGVVTAVAVATAWAVFGPRDSSRGLLVAIGIPGAMLIGLVIAAILAWDFWLGDRARR